MLSCIFIILHFDFDEFTKLLLIGKTFYIVLCTNICFVGAGKSTLMSTSDGLGPYFFRRKVEKTQPMKDQMYGEVFLSRQRQHFFFIVNMTELTFAICTLTLRVKNYVFAKEKV